MQQQNVCQIKSIESKCQGWELQLLSNNVVHFSTLRTEKPIYINTKEYAEENSESPTRI
jgi:hypothetical protein